VLRQCSWGRFTRFSATLGEITLACFINTILIRPPAAIAEEPLELESVPRVCTLSADDEECRAKVVLSWRSSSPVSVCLGIAERPQPYRCWQDALQGSYELELAATGDVRFVLTEGEPRTVHASVVLRVVRETKRYRHKRREPWNVFD
jgi:hypothetical protein